MAEVNSSYASFDFADFKNARQNIKAPDGDWLSAVVYNSNVRDIAALIREVTVDLDLSSSRSSSLKKILIAAAVAVGVGVVGVVIFKVVKKTATGGLL